ncbi:MAG: PEP-CTERM sorting domain-containing protein [Planctomycetota bacterium]
MTRKTETAILIGLIALPAASAHADPPVIPDLPEVFCFRITDIERVNTGDATPDNDFVFSFEALNWTNQNANGVTIRRASELTQVQAGTIPTLIGAGIDRDGRGGAAGIGSDIDAVGGANGNPGLVTGAGAFDPVSHQSGRGRGPDTLGVELLNDWEPTFISDTRADYFNRDSTGDGFLDGTALPFQDLIGAFQGGAVDPARLVPSQSPPYSTGDLDTLGDSAIDGGPGTTAVQENGSTNVFEGFGNVLDGFTFTVSDFDIGETLSLNWFLLDEFGNPIGTSASGNDYGFGTVTLANIGADGDMPEGAFDGNTGLTQSTNIFFDSVFLIQNPTEFAAEFGAGITAPFQNPLDQTLGSGENAVQAVPNTIPVPEPASAALMAGGSLLIFRRRQA